MKNSPVQFSRTASAQAVEDAHTLVQSLSMLIAKAQRVASEVSSLEPRPSIGSAEMLTRLLKLRRRRETLFPPGLFADPAWDILLDLYLAELQGKPVSVSSACLASAVPPTTGLRYISRLVELGLIERSPDRSDLRRAILSLSVKGRESMKQWLLEASA